MSHHTEEWRPISSTKGVYEVSNLGNVRKASYVSKILKARKDQRGHLVVSLQKPDGKYRNFRIDVLVSFAFVGERILGGKVCKPKRRHKKRRRKYRSKAAMNRRIATSKKSWMVKRRAMIHALASRDGGQICRYCKVALQLCEIEIDHVIPVCQGGPDHIDNRALSCRRCNQLKSGLLLLWWLRRLENKKKYKGWRGQSRKNAIDSVRSMLGISNQTQEIPIPQKQAIKPAVVSAKEKKEAAIQRRRIKHGLEEETTFKMPVKMIGKSR